MTLVDVDDELLAAIVERSDAPTIPAAVERSLWTSLCLENPEEVLQAHGLLDETGEGMS